MNQLEIELDIDNKHCTTRVNHLKKYSHKECWIIVGTSMNSHQVTELLLIENYANILKTSIRCDMNIINDKLYLLYATPHDPRFIPMEKHDKQSVWVVGKLIFSSTFIKHNSIDSALRTIEWLVNKDHKIDDLIVLIGRESAWPNTTY